MKNILFKKIISLVIVNAIVISISPFSVKAEGDDSEVAGSHEEEAGYISPSDPNVFEQDDFEESYVGQEVEESEKSEPAPEIKEAEPKVIFNSADNKIFQSIMIANSALPVLEMDINELSRLSNKSLSELQDIRRNNYDNYRAIAQEAEAKYFNNDYLKLRLLGDVTKLTELLNFPSETQTIREMQTNRVGIEAQIDTILDYKIDTKVIETLSYLVRPKDDPRGGAGHWKIKVNRIFSNYTREQTKESRESNSVYEDKEKSNNSASSASAATAEIQTIDNITAVPTTDSSGLTTEMKEAGATEKNTLLSGEIVNNDNKTVSDFIIPNKESEKNISSHFKGQAVDISEIDDIRCTVIKLQRIGPRQLEPRPPISIKLGWQTKSGYGEDSGLIDSSFNSVFLERSQDAMLDLLSSLNIDFENIDSIDTSDFGSMASLIGQAFFADAISGPSEDIWKFDLADILKKMGGVIIADGLGLDRRPFLDTGVNSIDALYEAIGRYDVENRMDLPYGSMNGKNRTEMMTNIGKGRFIKELLLPEGSLDVDINLGDEDALMEKIGTRIFEDAFGFNKGSLYGKSSLEEMSQSVGSMKFSTVISNPDSLDRKFYFIGSDIEGISAKFKSRTIKPRDYFIQIARAHISRIMFAYPDVQVYTIEEYSNRDKVLNLPEGSSNKFMKGEFMAADYYNLGITTLANALEKSDTNRQYLENWLKNPNEEFTYTETTTKQDGTKQDTRHVLDRANYASTVSINSSNIFQLLGATNGAKGIFVNHGRMIFADALKNSNIVKKAKANILNENPSLVGNIEDYEFIMERIGWIRDHISTLQSRKDAIDAALDKFEQNELSEDEKSSIKEHLSSLTSAVNGARNIGNNVLAATQYLTLLNQQNNVANGDVVIIKSALNNANDRSELSSVVDNLNAFQYELEMISKWTYEAVTGREQPDFRVGDTSVSELSQSSMIKIGDISLSASDMALFLSGKVKMENILLTIGSAKLSGALNLPPKALKYAAMAVQALFKNNVPMKDVFFRSVGMAAFEAQYSENNNTIVSQSIADIGKMDKAFSAKDIRDQLMKTQGLSQSRANQTTAKAFGLGDYDFEKLITDNDSVWMAAREDAEKNDQELSLPIGTTENFMRGRSEGGNYVSSISDDEIRKFSTYANVSEASLKAFIAAKNGDEISVNEIYYVDKNPYQNTGMQNSVCQEKTIPDGSYVYYDSLGLHTFNSFAAANEYMKANQDKKIDYITEIENALALMVGDGDETSLTADQNGQQIRGGFRTNYQASQVKADIESFINEKTKKYAFSDTGRDFSEGVSTFNIDEFISTKYKISVDLFTKIFSREESIEATVSQGGDIFKIIGYQFLKTYAADYLGQQIGINIGSARLTADDIFEMFSGNSKEVFAKIGGEILGEEMDLSPGKVQEILLADNSSELECAIYNAASGLLGNIFGSNGISVLGNAFDVVFSRQRVEKLLGLPDKSFDGNNINELLLGTTNNNKQGVPIRDMFRAFNIPVSKSAIALADQTLKQISNDYYSVNKGKSFYEKARLIDNYIESLFSDEAYSGSSASLVEAWFNYDETLRSDLDNFLNYIGDPTKFLWNNIIESGLSLKDISSYSNYTDEEIIITLNDFKNRLTSIDQSLSLESGSFLSMLKSEEGKGPNWIVGQVKTRSVGSLAFETVKKVLGLEESSANSGDFDQFMKDMGFGCRSIYGSACIPYTFNISGVYGFLDKLFMWNLDKKSKLPDNIISSILKNPMMALPALLVKGVEAFDRSLGFDAKDPNGFSFEYLLSMAGFDIRDMFNTCQTATSFAGCMNTKKVSHNDSGRKLDNIIDRLVNTVNTSFKFMGSTITLTAGDDGNPAQQFSTRDMELSRGDLVNLITNGDFRIVEVIALYSAMKNYVIKTDNEGNTIGTVPESLYFQYIDAFRMIYGNNQTEEAARLQAQGQAKKALESGMSDVSEDNNSSHNVSLPPNYNFGDGSRDGMLGDVDGSGDINVDDQVSEEINSTYGTETFVLGMEPTIENYELRSDQLNDYNSGMDATQFNEKHGEGSYDSFNSKFNSYLTDLSNWQTIRDAGNNAASRVRQVYRENFENKAADCMLNKLDSNIPAGFYWSMMHGNGFSKSVSIVAYLTNIIQNDKSGIINQNLTTGLVRYFHETDGIKKTEILNGLLENGVYDAIDDMFKKINLSVMGIDFGFENGTAKGIFDYITTGKFDSLNQIYNGEWLSNKVFSFADQKLKLPAGTTSTLYNNFRQYSAAQKAAVFWKQPIGELQKTEAFKGLKESMGNNVSDADIQRSGQQTANRQMNEIVAASVSLVLNLVFSDEVAEFENMLGLVPGTGSMLVTMLVQSAFGLPVSPMQIVMFLAMNLFGVYKVKFICGSNGMYPDGKGQTKDRVSYDKYDYTGLMDFNGENAAERESNFIKIAQYKADRLALDLYEMPYRTGDEDLVPLQVMTGRTESAAVAKPLVLGTACKKIGVSSFMKGDNGLETAICNGSRVGIWQNPQTTAYTHIGF